MKKDKRNKHSRKKQPKKHEKNVKNYKVNKDTISLNMERFIGVFYPWD